MDFSSKTKSQLFGPESDDSDYDEKAESSAWRSWLEFLKQRDIVTPSIRDLSKFMDFYVDSRSPSMKNILSTVHTRGVCKGVFVNDDKAYRILFRRVNQEYDKLGLNPTKALPLFKVDFQNLNEMQVALGVGLVQMGRRIDNVGLCEV
jgi:hypothetical protein